MLRTKSVLIFGISSFLMLNATIPIELEIILTSRILSASLIIAVVIRHLRSIGYFQRMDTSELFPLFTSK